MLQAFTKTVRIGQMRPTWSAYEFSVFAQIKFDGERLSITGVEGPRPGGNAHGGCGQIVMHEWDLKTYAPGFNAATVQRLREVWDEWHLNDMQAGSPAQTAYLKANPIDDRLNHYTRACEALAAADLNPDPNYLHNGKPYSYGHAWLKAPVPEEALAFLASLPDTDVTPAWV